MKDQLKILVVDDDRRIGQLFKDVLAESGHQVDFAVSGEEAVQISNGGAYDLIFLDMIMPGMSGLDTLKALKGTNEKARVVVMTGFSVLGMLESAEKSGAMSSLIKPFNISQIHEVVEQVFSPDLTASSGKRRKAILLADTGPATDKLVVYLGELNIDTEVCCDMKCFNRAMANGKTDLVLIYSPKWENETVEKMYAVRKNLPGMKNIMLVDETTEPNALSRQLKEIFEDGSGE